MRKMDLYRRVYQREIKAMRRWHRLVTKPLKLSDFEEAKELLYESCTECRHCTMVWPMGIDTALLVHHTRSAMVAAQRVPPDTVLRRPDRPDPAADLLKAAPAAPTCWRVREGA